VGVAVRWWPLISGDILAVCHCKLSAGTSRCWLAIAIIVVTVVIANGSADGEGWKMTSCFLCYQYVVVKHGMVNCV
jgi:hypothetical protein